MKLSNKYLRILFVIVLVLASHYVTDYYNAKSISEMNYFLAQERSKITIKQHLTLLERLRNHEIDKAINHLEATLDIEVSHITAYSSSLNIGKFDADLTSLLKRVSDYRSKLPNHAIKADEK